MSSPKLSMRDVRRHPATICNPEDLQPGMEVALCYLLPPIGRSMRCGQAIMGLMSRPKEAAIKRHEALRQGYRHTPTWGIVVKDVASVNWVNTTNTLYEYPHASFRVTQSSRDLQPGESLNNLAPSMAQVATRIQELPSVQSFDIEGNAVSTFERIAGFQDLGLAPEPYGINYFVIDLSKLE